MKWRDENRRRLTGLHALGLLVALFGWLTAVAHAQQLQLPMGSGQQPPALSIPPYPTVAPTPARPAPRSNIETLPQVQAPPRIYVPPSPPPPAAVYQPAPQPTASPAPILPAIFHGCWQGYVATVDSIARLPGGAELGPWTPKTYLLCYRRVGNGPFALTLTEAGIVNDRRITNATGKMQLVSTDGRTYAAMRALLQFDEYRPRYHAFGGNTFPVDELTNLDCQIEPDGMHVTGSVYGQQSGQPWFQARWHALFVRTAGKVSE